MRKWLGINWVDIENTSQADRYKELQKQGIQNRKRKIK